MKTKNKVKVTKVGRPEIKIDWDKVTQYLRAQCNGTGIAGILGISPDTLYRKCIEDHKTNFEAFSAQKKSEGKELLRAKQHITAMEGNVTMQIWLGKQYLDQRDRNELTGKDGSPLIPQTIIVRDQETKSDLEKLG